MQQAIIDAAHKQVETITKQFRRGLITDDERYERVISQHKLSVCNLSLSCGQAF
jgi:DNA-directed RNA polymerase beta' subunit